MKSILKNVLMFVCAAMLLLTTACGTEQPGGKTARVELETSSLAMKTGDTYKLSVTVDPKSEKQVWASDNDKIVTVAQDGTVRAVKQGTAVVSVTAGKASDYCQITVTDEQTGDADDEIKEDGYIYHEDFTDRTQVPGYLRKNVSGGGAMGVANGEMSLSTVGTGIAFATYEFDETLSGKIIAETRVKVSSNSFSNILFFYRGEQGYNNNDIIACLGMTGGAFNNNDGSGWRGIGKNYSVNTWYEIRMELDIGKSRYDLYIDGQKFSRLSFRNRGDGVEDRIKLLKFGTDKENAGLTYDYIRVSQGSDQNAPEIETERTVYRIARNKTDRVTFDYRVEGTPKPAVTLTAVNGNPDGAEISDSRTVTFAEGAAGTYNFTLAAENSAGQTEIRFTVIVNEDDSVLLDTDFTEVPAGMVFETNGGDAKVENGQLRMTTAASGSVLTMARYDFGEALTGKVRVQMRVTVGTNAFSNILFLYHSGITSFVPTSCTNSIAVENGVLKYNAGGWKSIANITLGTAFDLEVVFDFDNHTFDLSLNGEVKLTGGAFRKASGDTGVLIIGSDKVNTDMTFDSMSFVKETEA